MDKIEVETQNNTSASETKIDISDNTKEHGEEIEKTPSETNDYAFDETEKHRKSICRIFVSQYMDDTEYGSDDYVVTLSHKDKSVLGWSVNIEKNGPQQPDVYFKIDKVNEGKDLQGHSVQIDRIKYLQLYNSVLSKKILLLCTSYAFWLIDLNSDRTNSERFIELKRPVSSCHDEARRLGRDSIGFLPNGDLIQVSLSDRKIYKYCFKDKNIVPWKYSQINDIEIPESLYGQVKLHCPIYRTKLFLLVETRKKLILQFDLLTMNLERQFTSDIDFYWDISVIMNKNQTLLAIAGHILSMENGISIYKGDILDKLVEFITLKNNSERLLYHDGLDENKLNKLQQISNKIVYRNSIYSLSTFKIIQSMLNEIIDQVEIKKVLSSNFDSIVLTDEVEIKNHGLCKIDLYNDYGSDYVRFKKEDKSQQIVPCPNILSFKLLNNQDLVIINMEGISIYTMSELIITEGIFWFRRRYFWRNNEWNNVYEKFEEYCHYHYDIKFTSEHYKPLIRRILKNEFDDSKHSIPLPIFMNIGSVPKFFSLSSKKDWWDRNDIVNVVIKDKLVSSKYGIEMLKIAIKERCYEVVQQIIESIQDYSENYMTIISLNLAELCDYYPDYVIKYISRTSIMLSPHCNHIGNSKNTSLHSHTNYIKESTMDNIIFKFISTLYKGLIQYLMIKEDIQTVSFIVPFPQICVYPDNSKNNDHENENNDHESHDSKTLEIGSGVDTDIPGIQPSVDADIPGNRLQRGRRYSRNSVPAWIPIFQEIGSNVDADIPGNRLQRGRRYSRDIGSGVNTESQRYGKNQDSFEWASEDRKTKIRRVDFRRIDEPRFVSASRWIYRIRLSVLGFGYMGFNFRLGFRYMDFFRFLGVGYIGFDFWFLGFEYKDFGFRLLGVGYMGFVFRLLGVGYTGFDFQFSGFRYVGFDFRFSFGLLLNGFLFRTLSDRVSRR
ncbi:unnamed protein product [Rhizophagus irregularis]|nr:unnamed protein product [Rhizophagus irregularis]